MLLRMGYISLDRVDSTSIDKHVQMLAPVPGSHPYDSHPYEVLRRCVIVAAFLQAPITARQYSRHTDRFRDHKSGCNQEMGTIYHWQLKADYPTHCASIFCCSCVWSAGIERASPGLALVPIPRGRLQRNLNERFHTWLHTVHAGGLNFLCGDKGAE